MGLLKGITNKSVWFSWPYGPLPTRDNDNELLPRVEKDWEWSTIFLEDSEATSIEGIA